MLTNVQDFGAKGEGTNDDRPCIQLAIDFAVANSTGGILIPAGLYRVSRVPKTEVLGGRRSIDLNGVQDFMIMGEGPKSVVMDEFWV